MFQNFFIYAIFQICKTKMMFTRPVSNSDITDFIIDRLDNVKSPDCHVYSKNFLDYMAPIHKVSFAKVWISYWIYLLLSKAHVTDLFKDSNTRSHLFWMQLWSVAHFHPHFWVGLLLYLLKSEDGNGQLTRVAFKINDFLWNPHFKYMINIFYFPYYA